jgi:hypothetical protein
MHMRASIGPILDDVVVVGDFDVVDVDGAEFRHLRDEQIREAFPAGTAGVSGAALGLEHVPVPRLIRRDHQPRIDLGEGQLRPGRVRPGRARRDRAIDLGRQRSLRKHRARGNAGSGPEEGPPRRAGISFPRFAHGGSPQIKEAQSTIPG